jgi:quercetin dioxygenase-like cupin family protein
MVALVSLIENPGAGEPTEGAHPATAAHKGGGHDRSSSPHPGGAGATFDWANDTVRVLSPAALTNGDLTVAQDTLKPGFLPTRHHEKMTEVFYVLAGQVTFAFDDETITAQAGDTVNVVPGTRHEVSAAAGARIITIFSPGGFDNYLAGVRALAEQGSAIDAGYKAFGEEFDIWQD